MTYKELRIRTPYRIIEESSDGSFQVGDILWISPTSSGIMINLTSEKGSGFYTQDDLKEMPEPDFIAEPANNYMVFNTGNSELLLSY